MDHSEETKDEWHALYPLFLGFLRGVSRHCGTGKIREWGPPSPSITTQTSVRDIPENLHSSISQCEQGDTDFYTSTILEDPFKWYPDAERLMTDLVSGNLSLYDEELQKRLINWMSDEQYNEFIDLNSGEKIYGLIKRRGNKAYAAKKTDQKSKLCRALDGKEFDYPIGGRGNIRMTRLLFITVNFDRAQFTPEQAWYALRTTPVEGCSDKYNMLNKLNANLSKIFGKHNILTCKEAQMSGYPAPHIIMILNDPVRVKLHNSNGKISWRLDDPRILRRIGKDPMLRRLAFNDHRKMLRMHPIWKHGFIDFQGIVKGYKIDGKKDAFTDAFIESRDLSDGLMRSIFLPWFRCFLKFHPRKSNPFSIWVTSVFSWDNSSPRSARNGMRRSLTFSAVSGESTVTTKSSANLVRFALGNMVLTSFSIPFRTMFARIGDITPPCGLPVSVGNSWFPNTYPALMNSFRTCLSIGMLSIIH